MAIDANFNGITNTSTPYSVSERPEPVASKDDSTTTGSISVKAETRAGSETGAGTSKKDILEKLQKQITEAAKRIQELQQHLQQAQSGQASSEEKNAQVAAIQAQISSVTANMMAMQATMITLQNSVDTTA
ncbi:hypothetical protein [Pseudomonas sichuanensis]|uniref:hypothetical protein n=1 Tax=Pseudomonas sichuanensis TaxID=2213015 RepID=UPI00215F866B|nr:hypothetical protein [Pseudomonas sichuanensis]UVL87622.1 hypothetical protein LOY51_17765 [Pseudomonas sichuanensis]